jgi:hypothetical protein
MEQDQIAHALLAALEPVFGIGKVTVVGVMHRPRTVSVELWEKVGGGIITRKEVTFPNDASDLVAWADREAAKIASDHSPK